MTPDEHILICGRDAELLRTRGLVLQSAGYRVSMTRHTLEQVPDLKGVKLLIVCHTLSSEEREVALSTFADVSQGAKALCLVPHVGRAEDKLCTLDSFAGPRRMLEVVEQLLCA